MSVRMSNLKSSKDLEDYWGESKITPDDLDNFFDEDSTVPWTGSVLQKKSSEVSKNEQKQTPSSNIEPEFSAISIIDNITTDDSVDSTPNKITNSSSSHSIGKSLGSLGGKLQEWKPSSVKIFSGDKELNCGNCVRLEREIQQMNSQFKSSTLHENVALPISVTINKMILGQPYSLQYYTSLSDKKELLHVALYSGDTSVLLDVIIFCRNTLSKTLFMAELQQNSELLKVYIRHLKQKRQINEAVEILTTFGKFEEAAMIKYKQCCQISDHSKKIKALQQLNKDHLKHLPNLHYHKLVTSYIDLLEQQKQIDNKDSSANTGTSNPLFKEYPRASNIYDKSLLTTLYYCCMYHWSSNTEASPNKLRLKYEIPDKLFLWTVLRGRARVKHFYLPEQLIALVNTKTGMLGALSNAISSVGGLQTSIKHYLPVDRVIDALKQSNAPDTILAAYLANVEPRDTRLKLALQHGVNQAVVEAYIAMKDKAGLQKFMSTNLVTGSADHIKAENALKTLL